MSRFRRPRRITFFLLLAASPVGLACEAIVDFDRTPLQPVPEASVPDASPTDTSTDRGSSSGGEDAKADTGGPGPAPKDAGPDGDGGDK